MQSLYDANGLVFWNEREIRLRESMRDHFAAETADALKRENQAWSIHRTEAPLLTPAIRISV